MKKILTALLVLSLLFQNLHAASFPVLQDTVKKSNQAQPTRQIITLKPAEIQKLTVKKFSLLDKLKIKLIQKQLKRDVESNEEKPDRKNKLGTWSMILGLLSIPILFISPINLAAIPLAVAAIITGAISLKGNSNTKGMIGLIAGSATILLAILAIIAFIAFWGGFF